MSQGSPAPPPSLNAHPLPREILPRIWRTPWCLPTTWWISRSVLAPWFHIRSLHVSRDLSIDVGLRLKSTMARTMNKACPLVCPVSPRRYFNSFRACPLVLFIGLLFGRPWVVATVFGVGLQRGGSAVFRVWPYGHVLFFFLHWTLGADRGRCKCALWVVLGSFLFLDAPVQLGPGSP